MIKRHHLMEPESSSQCPRQGPRLKSGPQAVHCACDQFPDSVKLRIPSPLHDGAVVSACVRLEVEDLHKGYYCES